MEFVEQGDIAGAYKKLALAVHPDKNSDNPDADAAFKALSEAYGHLQHDWRRAYTAKIIDTWKRQEFKILRDEREAKEKEAKRRKLMESDTLAAKA